VKGPRCWLLAGLLSALVNLLAFGFLALWLSGSREPRELRPDLLAAAAPEAPPPLSTPEDPAEPTGPAEPVDDPLPVLASEPWLVAPLAEDEALRIEPEAVPPGLFRTMDGPAAPGAVAHPGRRTGVGTVVPQPPPVPEVTVQAPVEPAAEADPGLPPAELLAGLRGTGHVAVAPARVLLGGTAAEAIRSRVSEHRVYPDQAVDLGLEGRVETRFRLDPAGRVLDLEILNAGETDPLLVEGARRSIEAASPFPLPEGRTAGDLYLAVACWSDGQGEVKRLRMVEGTGRPSLDAVALDRARDRCRGLPGGWHVVELEQRFQVRLVSDSRRFVPSLVEDDLPADWASALAGLLPELVAPVSMTAMIRLPITFRLTW